MTENEGLNYVKTVTNRTGHIFREILKEDIGIDAQIEVCLNQEEPSGILIGVQIKTGESYIKSETNDSFIYYPSIDDLQYWRDYSLPVYLIIYRPEKDIAYWSDIKDCLKDHQFEDIISGIVPKKIIIYKNNTFSKTFFDSLGKKYGSIKSSEYLYNLFLQNLMNVSSASEKFYILHPEILKFFSCIDIDNAKKMLQYLNLRRDELVNNLIKMKGWDENVSDNYVNELILKTYSIIFDKENTGFLLITFEKKEDRNQVSKFIEKIIPFNRYLIMEGDIMLPGVLPMNYSTLIASDGWDKGQINLNEVFFSFLENKIGLVWNFTYDIGYYGSIAASRYLNSPSDYIFYIIHDTKDDFLLFDYLRLISHDDEFKQKSKWVSIGNDRIKVYNDWDPEIYTYISYLVPKIIKGDKLTSDDYFFLEREFEINTKEEIDKFIEGVKAAKSLKELPFMDNNSIDSIREGMAWNKDINLEN